jgi:cytochrome b involved in lipid metabolism
MVNLVRSRRFFQVLFVFSAVLFLVSGCSGGTKTAEVRTVSNEDSSITRSESGDNAPLISDLKKAEPLASLSSADLGLHDSVDDCWVGFEGKVYDITLFLPKHKEYEERLVPLCGESSRFEQAFTTKHGDSKVGVLLNESKLIGDLT